MITFTRHQLYLATKTFELSPDQVKALEASGYVEDPPPAPPAPAAATQPAPPLAANDAMHAKLDAIIGGLGKLVETLGGK